MALVALEQIPQTMPEEVFGHTLSVVERPQAYIVPELPSDEQVRAEAARFIGAVLLHESTVSEGAIFERISPIESLFEAIQLAANGDETARRMVKTNVKTDVVERTIKTGHIMEVDLMVDEAGKIQQHGQAMESVQANSLRYAANNWQMMERTKAETNNAFRIEHHYQAGDLENNSFVVISRVPDNMTPEEARSEGFFTDTMSVSIQITRAEGDRLVTESVFVSGVKARGEERHDQQTIERFAARFGADFSGKSATEMLDTPLLINNEALPFESVGASLANIFDECAGGTFMGEDQPVQDYEQYVLKCRERERGFESTVEAIVVDLLAEASHITSQVMATERLGKLSGQHMVRHAVKDRSINAEVFGRVSAFHLEQARLAYEQGNVVKVEISMQQAVLHEKSSSCPGGARSGNESDTENEDADCEFISKECPLCHKKNVRTRITKSRITGSCGCSKRRQ